MGTDDHGWEGQDRRHPTTDYKTTDHGGKGLKPESGNLNLTTNGHEWTRMNTNLEIRSTGIVTKGELSHG